MPSITTPTTVVASSYDTSGNGGRKLVRLSNGWLVAAVVDITNKIIYFEVSKDNGQAWSQLCFSRASDGLTMVSIVSVGTRVFALCGNATAAQPRLINFDATTVTNTEQTSQFIETVVSVQAVSLAINAAGTELHAAWSSKTNALPNSNNIRYAKGTIDGSGNVAWSSVTQVSSINTSGQYVQNPSISVKSDGNPIIAVEFQGSASEGKQINLAVFNGSTWSFKIVYQDLNYVQASPSAIVDSNGVIHVTWHGRDSTHSTSHHIRYSKSSDGGITWSAMQKLTNIANEQSYPSISVNKNNKIFIVWSGVDPSVSTYSQIRMTGSINGTTWDAITNLTNHTATAGSTSPSALVDKSLDFSIPLVIWKDIQASAVKFRGTWVTNQNPTLTLSSPADNQTLAEGNCEDTSKFTYTGGTASLDTTRKTQGNSSIKVTRNAANSYMTPTLTSIRPNVGDCYIAIADVYLDNAAQANYLAGNGSDITRNEKFVTSTSGSGFPAITTGQFVPIITAFQVTAVTTPGTSYFRPRLFNDGAIGQSYNVDSIRVYKITQAQYDALGTNVDLATAQTIASQYPYFDLTLSEGKTIQVEGSATDADNGNVVTVKYKINNGTARALNSGVSNGNTPISFAKTLTYSSKRIWDGSTDVAGVDLAENTDHTLTIWSEDDQGGKSAEVTRKFQVVWNRPPSISGNDTNLGAIGTTPSINYTVTEPESDSFTITEFLNGQQIRSFSGVAGQQNTATIDQDRWLRLALGVQHELRIRATDSKGQFADRIYTFTRTETQIQFALKNPFFCDAKPTRVLVTLDGTFPDGSTVLVEVCNNAYDTVPAYEDATGPSLAGRGYIFTNETKTAADWGINIRITINKGTATEKVILNGFGGAFD